jgi:hypothetical protein
VTCRKAKMHITHFVLVRNAAFNAFEEKWKSGSNQKGLKI